MKERLINWKPLKKRLMENRRIWMVGFLIVSLLLFQIYLYFLTQPEQQGISFVLYLASIGFALGFAYVALTNK